MRTASILQRQNATTAKDSATDHSEVAAHQTPTALDVSAGSQFLVWWLTCEDYCGYQPQQESNPLKIADYIWVEFCDRCGRPGRARLWVPDEIAVERMDADENDPRWRQYDNAGGIVIRAKDAPTCALWGGRFTDMALNALDFANVAYEQRRGKDSNHE